MAFASFASFASCFHSNVSFLMLFHAFCILFSGLLSLRVQWTFRLCLLWHSFPVPFSSILATDSSAGRLQWPAQRWCHGYHVAFSCRVTVVTWIQKLRRDASAASGSTKLVVKDAKENAALQPHFSFLNVLSCYYISSEWSAVLLHLNTFWTLVRMFSLVLSSIPHLPPNQDETRHSLSIIASPPSNPPSAIGCAVPFLLAFSWHFAYEI